MNEELERIFNNFKVDNIEIPVSFLKYNGKSNTYITYQETDKDNSLSADDEIINYVDFYDIDIYSKSNYLNIVNKIKSIMKENGWTWQPSRDSQDLFEEDTKLYHKTLCFAIEREEL